MKYFMKVPPIIVNNQEFVHEINEGFPTQLELESRLLYIKIINWQNCISFLKDNLCPLTLLVPHVDVRMSVRLSVL